MPRFSARSAVLEYSAQSNNIFPREVVYSFLMAQRGGYPNDHALACMLSSLSSALRGIPRRLGLSPVGFSQMLCLHFPTVKWPDGLSDQGDVLDAARTDERRELIDVIWQYRYQDHASTLWIAQILAAGCMGCDHLWRDLGLWSRDDLSKLIQQNYPALAQKNDRDMKWKKFFYKQLCLQEGVYTCRAPSCDVCVDYTACFGPEA